MKNIIHTQNLPFEHAKQQTHTLFDFDYADQDILSQKYLLIPVDSDVNQISQFLYSITIKAKEPTSSFAMVILSRITRYSIS